MKSRLTLATSLAFNAGVLVTLACSHGGEAMSALADTFGDTVAAAIRAADVTFDDAQDR